MKIIDITIPLQNNTPVWEGEKRVRIERSDFIEEGSEYNISRGEFGLHSGTHIDAPFHVFPDGDTIEQIPLEKLIGSVRIIKIPAEIPTIDSDCLEKLSVDNFIDRIIFKTTNSNFWNEEPRIFHRDFVALNTSGAKYLAELNLKLIGIDYFSVSRYDDLRKPHEILLEKQIVLLENVDLRAVEEGVYQLYCLPIKVTGTDGAPVRAVLIQN